MRKKHIFRLSLASALVDWLIAIGILILPSDNDSLQLPTRVVLPTVTNTVQVANNNEDITVASPDEPDELASQVEESADEPTLTITASQDIPSFASEAVADQYTIQFHSEVSADERAAYLDSIGASVQADLADLSSVVVKMSTGASPNSSALVAYSEPDYYVVATQDYAIPTSDPHFGLQWNLDAVNALDAWAALPDNIPTVTVAVIDSGICADHPDLAGRIVDGYDYVENDNTPQDAFEHGCAVAGVIAANIDNQLGMAGIAPNTQIMPLRVLDHQGIGTYSNTAAAIIYATNNGANIINLSLGGLTPSTTLQNAVNYASSRGVLVIASAGNTGDTRVLYPAAYPNAVAVGSVNTTLQISSFSSRGSQVDLWAPGENIVALMNDGNYGIFNGTSFAAPHAAAVAALEIAFGSHLTTSGFVVATGYADIPAVPAETAEPISNLYENNPRFEGIEGIENASYDPNLPFLTDFWVVELVNGTDGIALAQSLGFSSNGAYPNDPNTYVFTREGSAQNAELAGQSAAALSAAPQVLDFEQVIGQRVQERQFSDPLYPNQWHLNNTGQHGGFVVGMDANVVPAWNAGYTGSGVLVAVVDEGVQFTHPDLSSQYDASASYDYVSNDANASPVSTEDGHGTSVAGVAAANNDTNCGVGSAYDANISGIRLYGSDGNVVFDTMLSNIWSHDSNIDIYNNSWGYDITDTVLWLNTFDTMQDEVDNGRGGLGTIYVHAAGNAGRLSTDGSGNPVGIDVNSSPLTSTRFTIPVAALTPAGLRADYSTFGDAVFIAAPSSTNAFSGGTFRGTPTTDLLGSAGSTSGDCNPNFNGTSSAAPLVSGVIALMLDANPNLTWRDIRHILVETAERVDPSDIDYYSDWSENEAGYFFSRAYGFGNIDAGAATSAAATWTTVPSEVSVPGSIQTVNATIPSNAFLIRTTTINQQLRIEQVELRVNVTHSYRGDIAFFLESPSGTISPILTDTIHDIDANFVSQVMVSNRFWGESAEGTWTLYATDTFAPVDVGTLNNFQVSVHGYYSNNHINFPETVSKPSTIEFDNRGATRGGTDPVTSCGTFERTMWYKYTASGADDLFISVDNNAAVAVFSGTPGAFTEISCVSGNPAELHAYLPNAGSYTIMVGSNNLAPVVGQLSFSDSNNGIDYAIAVSNPSVIPFNNTGANSVGSDPNLSCGNYDRSLWYTYTATAAEDLRITLEHNALGAIPVLAVFSGTPGSLTQLDCAIGQPIGVNVNLPAAATYYIMAGSANSTPVLGQMTLSTGFDNSIIVVNSNSTTDNVNTQNNCANGVDICPLRSAIAYANSSGSNPTIAFALGTGVQRLGGNYTISNSMTIDATTQYGYSGTPLIEITGSAQADVNGFNISGAENVTIRGFAMGNFFDPADSVPSETSIEFRDSASNVLIEDNWFGLDASGNPLENGRGISIRSNGGLSDTITIDNNVIVNSHTWGVRTSGTNVTFTNNLIGIAPDGITPMPNGLNNNTGSGIFIDNDGPGPVYIGSTGNGNVVSGNTAFSIQTEFGASNVYIQANYVGTDASGTIGVTGGNRINIGGSQNSPTSNIFIGGNGTGEGNIISNGGIYILEGEDTNGNVTTNNIYIRGNYLGLDVTGTQSIPNDYSIRLGAINSLVENNVIGGNNPNSGAGIYVLGDDNFILNNVIGLDANDNAIGTFGNYVGILVEGDNNEIGDTAANTGNLISHNQFGIVIEDYDLANNFSPDGNEILGNVIGLNTAENSPIPNGYGIVVGRGATNTIIGGTTSITANIISGNTFDGIRIGALPAANIPALNMPADTTIIGNYIGTNASNQNLGNGGAGIYMKDGQDSVVGANTTAESNIIAYNGGDGIGLEYTLPSAANDNNVFFGNIIHSNGGLAIDLNNDGVTLNDVDDVDDGANDLQNFPNLLALTIDTGATTTTIDFELDGVPNTDYRVDFYYNSNTCDPSGFGEGSNWITNSGAPALFTTDGTGYYTGSVVISGLALNTTDLVSMIATDLDRGNTSEFSRCPLSPPVGFTANAISQVQIDLTWTGNHPDANQMTIERSSDGVSGWVELASFALPDLAHSDTGLDCGTTVYYRAKNTDTVNGATSAYTAVVNASTDACPPNDDFANASIVGSIPYTDSQQTLGATEEGSDPVPSCGTNTSNTIWYSFTPASTEIYAISSSGSNYDVVISLWIDSGGLLEQACDFNSNLDTQAFISAQLSSGTTYYIMLSGNNNSGGNAVLNVNGLPAPTVTPMPTLAPPPTTAPPAVVNAVGLFNPGTNRWQFRDANATGNMDITFQWGTGSNNQPLIGDWDGDNIDGISLYRNGTFIFRNLSNGGIVDNASSFGPAEAGWQAIAGDWNGDDRDSIGIYKNGQFMLSDDNSAIHYAFSFGPAEAGWKPVAGDWNGDGFDTVGLYKDGTWLLSSSSSKPGIFGQVAYGPPNNPAWKPVAGDWNADNTATIGLYGSGAWRVRANDNFGGTELVINFGVAGDWIPLSSYRGGVGNLSLLAAAPAPLPMPSITPIATQMPTAIVPMPTATTAPVEEATEELIVPEITPPVESSPEAEVTQDSP